MININVIEKSDQIKKISVSGHSDKYEGNLNLLCAGVSSIMFGILNSLDTFGLNKECITVLDNEIIIENNQLDNEVINNIFTICLIQLKTIEKSNNDFIKIKEEVSK